LDLGHIFKYTFCNMHFGQIEAYGK
jgi:hypothetical protein